MQICFDHSSLHGASRMPVLFPHSRLYMSSQLSIARAVWWSFAGDTAAKKKKKGNKCMLRYVMRVQRRDSPGYTAFHSNRTLAAHEFDIGGGLVLCVYVGTMSQMCQNWSTRHHIVSGALKPCSA